MRSYLLVRTENEFEEIMERIFARFPPSSCNDTREFACCQLADDIVNDWVVICPGRRLATAILETNPNVWMFNFDQSIGCPE
jgi:hypothetical protein